MKMKTGLRTGWGWDGDEDGGGVRASMGWR